MEEIFVKDCLRLPLDHFGDVGGRREAAKANILCARRCFWSPATIAGCGDYDEIAAWGALNVGFLRRYSEYFFGVPKEDWLRTGSIRRCSRPAFSAGRRWTARRCAAGRQPSLYGEAAQYFDDPATTGLRTIEIADKDHGRIEPEATASLMMSPG